MSKEIDYEKQYPNRHKEIHSECCKNCPSDISTKKGVEDIEAKDIKENYSKEFIAKELLFVCAWRRNKLCKGLCDYMNINQKMLDEINLK
jgi:hypothetical protein